MKLNVIRVYNVGLLALLLLSGGGIPFIIAGTPLSLLLYLMIAAGYLLILRRLPLKGFEAVVTGAAIAGVLLGINYLLRPYGGGAGAYGKLLVRIVFLVLLWGYYRFGKFCLEDDLYAALKLVMFHALANFLICILLDPLFREMVVGALYAKTLLFVFWSSAKVEAFGLSIPRNPGIFWEPGVLQFYLNLLLFMGLRRPGAKWTPVLAGAAVLTTQSSIGYAILAIQVFGRFVSLRMLRRNIVYLVPAVMVAAAVGYFTYTNVSQKVAGIGIHSFRKRIFDAYQAVRIIRQAPWTGIGVDPATYRLLVGRVGTKRSALSAELGEFNVFRGNTNSFLMLFVRFGLFGGLLYVVLLCRQTLVRDGPVMLPVIVILTIMSEPLSLVNPFLLFVISPVMSRTAALYGTAPSVAGNTVIAPERRVG